MALNEDMNEEQDMPVPQEPVQQQEEVTLPQPLTKEEEEKILAREIPEFPEEVPTELVEDVAKGVEDALGAFDAQAQEPSMGVIYPPPGQEPGGIGDAELVEDVISNATTPQVEDPAQVIGMPPAPVQEPRMGPETIFEPGGFERYYIPDKKDIDVDYVFSDPKGKVSVIFNRGYVDDMVNSQGYVVGSNYLVRELIKMDRQLAEEKGIDFSFRNAYLGSMADLYIDAMKRLGKNVSKLNPNSQRFQMYAASKEGAREIDQALTFIYYHDKFNGEIPGNIKNKLELPEGRGRLDSRFAGLTDREYENMGRLGKIGYNIAVAGKTMADVALPFWGDITPEVVPDVAPVGEIIGTFAGYMVPFSAASKVMAAKNFLQAEKYGRIPGVLVRGAVAGVAADSYVFDSDEGTLGNVFAEFDSKLINNAFTTALAIDIDDPEWEAKAKIALEGVILGGALDATVSKLRKLKLGERIPGFFKKMEARLGGDGLPKTSGFTPELDKALLELKTQRQSLQEEADKVANKLAETSGSGYFVQMLGAKLKETKDKILELATAEDVLEGKYVDKDKLEALANTTKKRVNKLLGLPEEEFVEPDNLDDLPWDKLRDKWSTIKKDAKSAGIKVSQHAKRDEIIAAIRKFEKMTPEERARAEGKLLDLAPDADEASGKPEGLPPSFIATRLREKIEQLKKAETTLEGAVKVEETSKIIGEIEETFEKSAGQIAPEQVKKDFDELLLERETLKRFRKRQQTPLVKQDIESIEKRIQELEGKIAIPELVEGALLMYKANPSLQNQTRLALAFDILEEASLPLKKERKRRLVPAEIKTNLENLSTISTKSDVELEEILLNRGKSNKVSPEVIAKQIEKRGIEGATKLTLGRVVRNTSDMLVDMRTNNILYSLGIPTLATAGGILVKTSRSVEDVVGRIAHKLKIVKPPQEKQKLIEATSDRIKDLEDRIYKAANDTEELELENELKKYKLQLRNLDRTKDRAKEEIKILKKIEAETNDETLKKLLAEAEEMGLVVEDPRIRREAKRLWKEVDNLRAAGESPEKIEEAVKLAKKQTDLVPKENPTRISDLEEELKAIKDPTYRRVDTTAETIDNIFYTLSGGRVQLAGRSPEAKDILELLFGLLNASAPSRIDPSVTAKSESALGAGLRAGQDELLGIDPAGLGRLGKAFQGIENPVVRNILVPALSLIEFLPRKGLSTIDEALRTRDFIREFLMRLDENIKTSNVVTSGVGVPSLEQQELVKEIQEAFLSILGNAEGVAMKRRLDKMEGLPENKRAEMLRAVRTDDAIDFTGAIMGRLRDARKAKEAIDSEVTPQLEQDLVLLERLRQLENLPEGVKESIDETLDGVVKVTKKGRLRAEREADIQKVVQKTVEEASQFARETTITQDVPPMAKRLTQMLTTNATPRALSPFARARFNVATMAMARIPIVSLLIRKERQALSGALGKIEQRRSIGKIAVGFGLGYAAYKLTDTDGEDKGVRLEVEDKGSWKEYNVVVPMSGRDFEDQLRASALRWYTNNPEIIARELEREGLPHTPENAVEYILDNLPEWEDRAGSVKINISRLGPFNTLVEGGMFIKDISSTTPWEYMTEREEERSPIMDIVTQILDFVSNQGYLSAGEDFFKLLSNPEYAAEAFVRGWGADLISLGKGISSTAGEPLQLDFRPSREEESVWQQKVFNQPIPRLLDKLGLPFGAEDPNTLMKKRDFLGRVIDAPDRAAHIVGKKYDVDLITSEMEELGFVKRVSKPLSVPDFPDIDLRKFKLKRSLMTEKEKEDFDNALVDKDGQNAYEDFLIMSGSTNVSMNRYDLVKGSAINGLQEYFKSPEYKTLKDTILSLEEGYTRAEQLEAEAAYEEIRKNINDWTARGKKKAASIIYNYAHLYVNEDGESLAEVQDALTNATRQAEFEVNKRLQGLDALRSGGNK